MKTRPFSGKTTMTNTTCGGINSEFTKIYLPTVYVLVFIIGLFGNYFGLKSVRRSWKKLGNINVFILNLGVADLLYVATLPLLVVYYATGGRWIFGRLLCKITRFLFNLNLYCSIGFLTCISVYRYLGIVHPLKVKGRINTCHSVAISIIVWLLVIIQILPDMFFDKTSMNSSEKCYDTTDDSLITNYLPYSAGWTVSGFCVPLLVILGCYGHIAVVLASNANVDALLKQRCLKLVVILVVLFSVCFIPYHVLRNLNLKTRILKNQGICKEIFKDVYIAYQATRGLACTNSALNPLIYLVGNDDFLLRCNEISNRARTSLVHMYRKPKEPDFIPMNSSEDMGRILFRRDDQETQ